MRFWAAILLLNISFFLVQPVFPSQSENKCIKNCCPESSKDKKECPKNCNPFFTCIYCQYIVTDNVKIKAVSYNTSIKHFNGLQSSILIGYVSTCLHPPDKAS